jgi:cellulose biosynthesis protein BcsQ
MASKTVTPTTKEKGDAYEQHVSRVLERLGWKVEAMPPNRSSFDLIATRGNLKIAVQTKDLKTKATEAKIRQFGGFMTSTDGQSFHEGWFVTRAGCTRGALAYIAANPQARIRSFVAGANFMGQIGGVSDAEQHRIGVFTFKGGVGKSKVALLLAGALAYRNKNVFIVDLNRAQNLYRLIGEEGLFVDRGAGAGGTVSVLGRDDWNLRKDEWKYGPLLDADYVIYDCPQFFEKPAERAFLPHLDVVIAPLQLNTDSIGADHHVLRDTVSEVRRENERAPIVFIVNNLRTEQQQGPMKEFLKAATDVFNDRRGVHLLPLDQFAIPYHRTLEELGQQHALNPHSQVEMVFSRPGHADASWLRPALRLADMIIRGDFWRPGTARHR